jgi:hypothetical protein
MDNLAPNTTYTVRLHFAETYWTAAGQRQFNVSIQSQRVETNLDVFAQAGANTALVKQYTATSDANGLIEIDVSTGAVDNPMISGVEIF